MQNFRRYIRRLKELRLDRTVAASLAFLLFIGGGFLGLQHFEPEERSLDLTGLDTVGQEVSLDMPVDGIVSGAALGDDAADDEESSKAANTFEYDITGNGMQIAAKSAFLMDAGTGAVLYAFNENEELPPASVTKVMTILLILEAVDSGKVSLDDTVTVSENAASMGGSQMYLEPGEQHTLEEIMKGIVMVSANDGCVAAAEFLSGTVEIFVENMNKRATELGMEHTHFANTNGLPIADHYSSARDIAVMSRELLKHTADRTWFTTWQDTVEIGLPGKEKEFGLTNTNKLIRQYQGAIGLKTGFTSDAGYCLSGAAERDGTTLIAVVMGCETSKIRLAEITKLLDYGFATYETALAAEKGQSFGEVVIEKGTPQSVDAVAAEELSLLVPKGQRGSVTSAAIFDENISVPLKKGDKVGEVVLMHDGSEISRCDLVADEDVKRAGVFEMYTRLMDELI